MPNTFEVNKVKGFAISYDTYERQFIVKDDKGDEVAAAPTQLEAEAKAEKLSRHTFKPFPAVNAPKHSHTVTRGTITSVNLDHGEAWFSYKSPYGGGATRCKVVLRYEKGYHELTPGNEPIVKKIEECMEKKAALDDAIEALIDTLDRPINPEYFKAT